MMHAAFCICNIGKVMRHSSPVELFLQLLYNKHSYKEKQIAERDSATAFADI